MAQFNNIDINRPAFNEQSDLNNFAAIMAEALRNNNNSNNEEESAKFFKKMRLSHNCRSLCIGFRHKSDEFEQVSTLCKEKLHGYDCGTSTVGSTATAAIVTSDKIIVANCGDSRAVLCRGGGGRDFPLSAEHKPDRPDELARIEATGGRVMYLDRARVQGVLAMSRVIGDKFLKPIVISEPEITITRRDPEDECIIIASDGFWDVIPNHRACKVALQGLQEANIAIDDVLDAACTGLDEECPTLSARVAALLTCLALGKDSTDNISVIVVDLKSR
ncbi:protein phosphatase 2C 37-like [Silene latifolia]|uniref:protein phosphatase 2C 37-like n=1 Tax=Silene latifolia TaxID=37657 RepID=UPI003D784CDB